VLKPKTFLVMKKIQLLVFISLIAAMSCRKSEVPKPPPPTVHETKGTPMPKGTTIGTATTKTIGAAGGTIASTDGGISVSVPAGAVSSNTTFTVQPITNELPTELGLNYRLLPEGTHFAQPVTITFHYTDDAIEGSREEDLLIATQDSTGVWQSPKDFILNKTDKTIAVRSNHFSDWATITKLRLLVDKPSIDFNEKANLTVKGVSLSQFSQDLAKIDSSSGQERAIEWSLNKDGELLQLGGRMAIYIAPSFVPSPNPVGVTAKVDNGLAELVSLTRRIYVAKTYFEIVMDGTTNIYPNASAYGNGNQVFISSSNTAGNGGSLILPQVGAGSLPFGSLSGNGATVNLKVGGITLNDAFTDCDRKPQQLSGIVTITKWSDVNGYVEGTYSGTLHVAGSCAAQTKTVSGRFRAKRMS
jgi:hypothetical protein